MVVSAAEWESFVFEKEKWEEWGKGEEESGKREEKNGNREEENDNNNSREEKKYTNRTRRYIYNTNRNTECTPFAFLFHGFYMFFYRKTGGRGRRTECTRNTNRSINGRRERNTREDNSSIFYPKTL